MSLSEQFAEVVKRGSNASVGVSLGEWSYINRDAILAALRGMEAYGQWIHSYTAADTIQGHERIESAYNAYVAATSPQEEQDDEDRA